jgi:hypothetical protein
MRCLAFLLAFVALNAAAGYAEEKSRIAPLRDREPQRYATELDALLARYAADLAPGTAEREYLELGALVRFRLRDPDRAIAAFEAARRAQRERTLDLASLSVADTQRFDKKDARKAAEGYRAVLRSLQPTAVSAPDVKVAAALRQWLGHELAYLEQGKRFSGAVTRSDMEAAGLWLMIATMQEPLRTPLDDATLAALPPSQFQIARTLPTLFELPPRQMLAFFGKHDPAGYLTAATLAAATLREPSPFVKAAADTFFRERGIRAPSTAADARYASPNKTWSAFLGAAKKGNPNAMLDCLTPEMQAKFGALFRKMSRDELRALSRSFVGFALQESTGEFREAMVVRQQDERKMGGMITFVKEGANWKIAEM